jgi:hypothetical protein
MIGYILRALAFIPPDARILPPDMASKSYAKVCIESSQMLIFGPKYKYFETY